MKASVCVGSAACIAFLQPRARSSNAAASVVIRSVRSPNCWPRPPIRSGRGSAARPGMARIKLSGGQFAAPITKLMGPVKWLYFYLYVILDIDRRRVTGWRVTGWRVTGWRVTGWRVEPAESAGQFKALFQGAMVKHAVPADQLTLHADRGAAMKAKATALRPADPGVVRSHRRPQTSNDNPFSQAQFKTLKYQPEFPKRFQTIDEARAFCRRFFAWYNQDHHHAGIGLMTPDQIHFGQADTICAARQTALDAALQSTPERFVRKRPKPPQIPTAAWINPPKNTEATQPKLKIPLSQSR